MEPMVAQAMERQGGAVSRIDEIQARLNEALKVRPYEEQDRDEHKSRAWSDFYQHAPADLAWLLGEVERLSAEHQELTLPDIAEPSAAEVWAAAEESEYHEQWDYDENGFPHCECGASLVESEHDLGVAPSMTAHQTREALLAARKAARREKAARHE